MSIHMSIRKAIPDVNRSRADVDQPSCGGALDLTSVVPSNPAAQSNEVSGWYS